MRPRTHPSVGNDLQRPTELGWRDTRLQQMVGHNQRHPADDLGMEIRGQRRMVDDQLEYRSRNERLRLLELGGSNENLANDCDGRSEDNSHSSPDAVNVVRRQPQTVRKLTQLVGVLLIDFGGRRRCDKIEA